MSHIELGQQIKKLKHEADFLTPYFCQLAGGGVVDVHAVQTHGARSRRIQTAQDVHEGGFATARRADNGSEISSLNIQAHPIQSANGFAPQMVDLLDVA